MSRVRDHWSIGEVLSLLQDEFPEVTISKIRFLESQGLIDPDRTSSGYRRFSDGDYDRLYWILEQQRDNYLPLRVIRDRLEEGQDIGPAPRRNDSRIGESLPDDDYADDDAPADDAGIDGDGDGAGFAAESADNFDAPEGREESDSSAEKSRGPDNASNGSTDEIEDVQVSSDSVAGSTDAEVEDPGDQPDTMFRDALAETEGPITAPDPTEVHPVRKREENSLSDALTEAARLRVAMSRPGNNEPPKSAETAAGRRRSAQDETPWAGEKNSLSETETLVLSDDVFEAVVVTVPAGAGDGGSGAASAFDGRSQVSYPHAPGTRPEILSQRDDAQAPLRAVDSTPSPPPSTPTSPTISSTTAAPTIEEDMTEAADPSPAPRLLGTRTEGPKPTAKSRAEVLAPPPRPTLPGSSVALDRDELAEQSGCTPGMIDELEKHGMISPRDVAGTILFDSTALTLARLAVQFGRFGLEARHLRTFRLSAEREVALLTQSIGPTLKANNAETRRRSFDTLQDLAELSASLRSIIVRDLVADLEPGG